MAASNFANAIDALVAERDLQFVRRIAADYNLDFDELNAKYLETAAVAIKVPKKYKQREPKVVNVVTEPTEPKAPKAPKEKQCCTAHTSKKEPCKFSALKGEVFCKRHLKASITEANPTEPKEKAPKKTVKKAPQPVHTHELTVGVVSDCDLCQSHGNPLTENEDFEIVTVRSRLAEIISEAEEAEDSDAAEDAYEDED